MNELFWETPEYMHTEKGADWYWIVGIISITISILSVVLGNILFAVLIIVGSFTLCLYASRPPELIPIKINQKGIRIKDLFYPYNSLESFWVEEEELHPRIIIKSQKTFSPHIVVLIHEIDPDDIRDMLLQYLPEEKQSEPFLEKLFIYFGF